MRKICYLGDHPLKPCLALPTKGRLVAIELIPEHEKLALISYVFISPETASRLYEQYRHFYRSDKARWIGKIQGGTGPYAFAVRTQLGTSTSPDGTRIVFKISVGISDEEMKVYHLSRQDKSLTLVSATLYSPKLDEFLRKQSEFTLLT